LSVDTPVCSAQTRKFNEVASEFSGNLKIYTVSADLPFAQKRFCGAEGIDKVENLYYKSVNEFTYDLELIKNSLISTDLTCDSVNNLLTQVHIFGFSLASLDIRQESTRHSDAIQELTNYLDLSVHMTKCLRKRKLNGS